MLQLNAKLKKEKHFLKNSFVTSDEKKEEPTVLAISQDKYLEKVQVDKSKEEEKQEDFLIKDAAEVKNDTLVSSNDDNTFNTLHDVIRTSHAFGSLARFSFLKQAEVLDIEAQEASNDLISEKVVENNYIAEETEKEIIKNSILSWRGFIFCTSIAFGLGFVGCSLYKTNFFLPLMAQNNVLLPITEERTTSITKEFFGLNVFKTITTETVQRQLLK